MTDEQFKALEKIWYMYGSTQIERSVIESRIGYQMLWSLVEGGLMEKTQTLRGGVELFGLTEAGEDRFQNEAQNRIQGT